MDMNQKAGTFTHITQTNLMKTSNIINKEPISCHRVGCFLKVICKCTECMFYYCYEHIQSHPHPREKLEILK
jgi:hypothetical protein